MRRPVLGCRLSFSQAQATYPYRPALPACIVTKAKAPKFDPSAFEKRHQQMRMNAGDWLLKKKNTFKLCQQVLLDKYYGALEDDSSSDDLICFLQAIDDAVDLLAQTVAELRNVDFWPSEEESK